MVLELLHGTRHGEGNGGMGRRVTGDEAPEYACEYACEYTGGDARRMLGACVEEEQEASDDAGSEENGSRLPSTTIYCCYCRSS